MSVAIVEDEVMIAFLIQDVLESFGLVVGAVLHSFEDAKNALETTEFDGVLLDLNLQGIMATPLALMLKERGTPVLIVSSYTGSIAQSDDLKDIPALAKPFSDCQMKQALQRIGLLPVLESLTSDSSSVDITAPNQGAADVQRFNTPSSVSTVRHRN